MNTKPLLYLLLLFIGTGIFYLLPFIPALYEWKKKTDTAPPRVNFIDRTIVEYSIRMFKEFINTHFAELIAEFKNLNISRDGKKNNSIDYLITGQEGLLPLSPKEIQNKKTNKVIIMCKPGRLPDDIQFTNKIYCTDKIEVGTNCKISELFAEGDIVLNSKVNAETFIYSDTSIVVKGECCLPKYTRARYFIRLFANTQFQYLHARRIGFGDVYVDPPEIVWDVIAKPIPRKIVEERLVIPNKSEIISHFIAKDTFYINSGCKIKGNIKAYKTLEIEENTSIMGAIMCKEDLYIGNNCIIQGPIIASGNIYIGRNCIIGARDYMTTIVAENIEISSGCYIAGLVLAKLNGNFAV